MANRYANLVGSNKISEEYTKINDGFDAVETDMDGKAPASVGTDLAAHIGSGGASHAAATPSVAGFMSAGDKTKLDGVEEGAETNQNAFAQVNDIDAANPSDGVTLEGGVGITVTTNPTEKKVTITATGSSTPGPHGPSHTEFGPDPVPNATETEGGLMSAVDKAKLDGMGDEISDLAGAGRTTETVKGNADELAALKAETVTGWFNVKSMFGAKGDGLKDDTAAINSAIAAANANGRGVIFFPPGIYVVSSALTTITSYGVFIKGSGAWCTKISHTSLTSDLLKWDGTSISTLRAGGISDINIVHANGKTAGTTVKLINSQMVTIENVQFQNAFNFLQIGEHSGDTTSNFHVVRNVNGALTGNGVGIEIRSGSVYTFDTVQLNNDFTPNGICFKLPTNQILDTLTISNCIFQRFNQGLYCNAKDGGGAQNIFVTNTIFDRTQSQSVMFLPEAAGSFIARCSFVNCWFTSDAAEAIYLNPQGGTIMSDITFDTCRTVETYKQALRVYTNLLENLKINNCSFTASSEAGSNLYPAIELPDHLKKFDITNNTIGKGSLNHNHASYAIKIGLNCDQYTIANNNLEENVTGAILDAGGTFTRKSITNNRGYNPVGVLGTPAMPASGVAQNNIFSFRVQVFFFGGTITNVVKNGTAIGGMTSGSIILDPGETLAISYSAAPTWTWFGL